MRRSGTIKKNETAEPTLFDFTAEGPAGAEGRDNPALDEWCFLYTATETGTNSGIRFMMTRDDAMRWCSSDLSKGVFYGVEWAYFFTSVRNFAYCHWGGEPLHEPGGRVRGFVPRLRQRLTG